MGGLQVACQFFHMPAVQMDDAAAGFAAKQEAGVAAFRVGTVLEESPFLRMHAVNTAGDLQFFQLAINGGKSPGVTGLMKISSQIRGGQSLLGSLL